jgi:hypothetical protein
VVVAGGEEAQVVGSGNGGSVGRLAVANGKSVLGDGSLGDIVASLTTDKETLVTNGGIEGSSGTLEDIGEEAGVDGWLLVEEVDLATI